MKSPCCNARLNEADWEAMEHDNHADREALTHMEITLGCEQCERVYLVAATLETKEVVAWHTLKPEVQA